MEAALTATFGATGDSSYRYDGKTDIQIVRELMRGVGHDDDHIEERMEALVERYLTGLRAELAVDGHQARVLAGVPEVLDALESRDDVVLGLLTGNIAGGAELKLAAAGIDFTRFRVGAYGSDHAARPQLPAVARSRARELLGLEVEGASMVIIGDTPADIDCGRSLGARAIAVATGRYGMEELREHEPAALFRDLTDTAAVIAAVVGD